MIPPLIPLSVVPVTSQFDPVKQAPAIAPVVPAQPTGSDSSIDLRQRDPEEAALLLREEQQRRQRQRRNGHAAADEHLPVPGNELNADNTVPVAPLIEDEPRQGLWVDIQV